MVRAVHVDVTAKKLNLKVEKLVPVDAMMLKMMGTPMTHVLADVTVQIATEMARENALVAATIRKAAVPKPALVAAIMTLAKKMLTKLALVVAMIRKAAVPKPAPVAAIIMRRQKQNLAPSVAKNMPSKQKFPNMMIVFSNNSILNKQNNLKRINNLCNHKLHSK